MALPTGDASAAVAALQGVPPKNPEAQQQQAAPSTTASTVSKERNSRKRVPDKISNVTMKDFKHVRDLGRGSYGVVQLVNLRG